MRAREASVSKTMQCDANARTSGQASQLLMPGDGVNLPVYQQFYQTKVTAIDLSGKACSRPCPGILGTCVHGLESKRCKSESDALAGGAQIAHEHALLRRV